MYKKKLLPFIRTKYDDAIFSILHKIGDLNNCLGKTKNTFCRLFYTKEERIKKEAERDALLIEFGKLNQLYFEETNSFWEDRIHGQLIEIDDDAEPLLD